MFPSDALAQAIARGERLPASAYIAQLPVGASVYIGCDMAFATGIKNDQSSLCGIMVRGDGTRIVMFSDAGRWGSEETMRRVQVAQQQFAGAQVTTECNGPQQMVVEQLRKRGVNVSGYATGGGQRSLLYLAELASSEFSKGQYVIPSVGGQPASAGLAALVGDLGAFVRNASHVPDRVSAYLLASYAARRGEQRVTFFDTARTGFSLSR
jgi:hypothetical protein